MVMKGSVIEDEQSNPGRPLSSVSALHSRGDNESTDRFQSIFSLVCNNFRRVNSNLLKQSEIGHHSELEH